MTFGAPEFILALIVVPFLLAVFAIAEKRSRAERKMLLDPEVEAILLPETSGKSLRGQRKVLLFSTFLFLGLALVRPQFGYREISESRAGIDLVFAVDVSKSMLAKDLSPSRLERVRFLILDLLPELRGDRIGLVTFAGVSFTESPLTYDYATFRLFLDDLSPDLIPVAGTNLESALREAAKTLGLKRQRDGAIVLMTDGEAFSGDLDSAVREINDAGIKVFTVGVGSEVGAPIPEETGYKVDDKGKVVLTKLSTRTLEEIARKTGGAYLGGSLSGSALKKFYTQDIAPRFKRSEIVGGVLRVWNEYFQIPLFAGLVFYLFLYGPIGRKR